MEAYLESVEKRFEELLDRAQSIIIAEKTAQGLTVKNLVTKTNLSEDVIKNICSTKKHLKNTGYPTMTTIAKALGIDLNFLADYQPPIKNEVIPVAPAVETSVVQLEEFIKGLENQIDVIVSICESRVADARADADKRIEDMRQFYETRIEDLNRLHEIRIKEANKSNI